MSWIEDLSPSERLRLEELKLDAAKTIGPKAVGQWLANVAASESAEPQRGRPKPLAKGTATRRRPRWRDKLRDPEVREFVEARFSMISDSQIALETQARFGLDRGVAQQTVSAFRRSLGIAAVGKPGRPTKRHDERQESPPLRVEAPAVSATEAEQDQTEERAAKPANPIHANPEVDAYLRRRLGQIGDLRLEREVRKRFGRDVAVTYHVIRQARKLLGIKPYGKGQGRPIALDGENPTISGEDPKIPRQLQDPAVRELVESKLGKTSDSEIAREVLSQVGGSWSALQQAICTYRNRLGIPTCTRRSGGRSRGKAITPQGTPEERLEAAQAEAAAAADREMAGIGKSPLTPPSPARGEGGGEPAPTVEGGLISTGTLAEALGMSDWQLSQAANFGGWPRRDGQFEIAGLPLDVQRAVVRAFIEKGNGK